MGDPETAFWLVVGFGLVLVAGSKLGAGTPTALTGLFAPAGQRDWPTGVQEADAPRFAVTHLDELRRDAVDRSQPDIVELGTRRIDPS